MGKRAPAAPDPFATAAAQGQVNADSARTQARMNRNNTVSPFGMVTNVDLGEQWLAPRREQAMADYAGDPGFNINAWSEAANRSNPFRDQWETRVSLSPEQQQIMDQANRFELATGQMALDALPRARRIMEQPFSLMRDDADARNRATAGIMSRMEPAFARDREALEGRLLSQGFQPGTEAYRRAADELNRNVTDARMQAITAGLGESRAAAGFNNQATMAERQQPLSELAMLFGLGNGMQMPQAQQVAATGLNAPDLQSAIYQNYQQKNQNQQATNANWFGLLGSAARAGGAWAGSQA